MNRENLQRMADYIRTIPQDKFHMAQYRLINREEQECNSVGCVIGFCTILDNINNIPRINEGEIYFSKWSYQFTDLIPNGDIWQWCFDSDWQRTDNTPTGAAERIEWLLNNGLPEDWREQMRGDKPLIYKQTQ
jgi:hypothetical protein